MMRFLWAQELFYHVNMWSCGVKENECPLYHHCNLILFIFVFEFAPIMTLYKSYVARYTSILFYYKSDVRLHAHQYTTRKISADCRSLLLSLQNNISVSLTLIINAVKVTLILLFLQVILLWKKIIIWKSLWNICIIILKQK